MSSYTHLCLACGAIRRRPLVVWRLGAPQPAAWPVCHGAPMRRLVKAHAEAATKLAAVDRIVWAQKGLRVYARPGRRWSAALTKGQIAQAEAQVAWYARATASRSKPQPVPRAWKAARQAR